MDLYTALQPHIIEAAARAAAAAVAEQQAAQDDAEAAASRDKQISLTLMGLPNVVRSTRPQLLCSKRPQAESFLLFTQRVTERP